jgi:prophage maintenance system killer protein
VSDSRERRFRDTTGSRFYRARDLSPEETWERIRGELARVLNDARDAFFGRPRRIDLERVRWWHGAIFSRLFPHEGGRFREEPAFHGVVLPGGGQRELEGTPPAEIRRGLKAVCDEFNRCLEQLADPDRTGVLDRCRAAAALYAGIIRVHPFVDGNHRTAFVALSAALWSLGLPNVEFASDEEMLAHDHALAPALLPDGRDSEEFAQLLTERIESARKDTM